LTWDSGLEMAQHKSFTVATDVKVLLLDPHAHEHGGNKRNTNSLLRQYLPKRTDLRLHAIPTGQDALRTKSTPREKMGLPDSSE